MAVTIRSGLSPHSLIFNPNTFHVRLVVDKVALGQFFIPVPRFSLDNITPPMIYTRTYLCATCAVKSYQFKALLNKTFGKATRRHIPKNLILEISLATRPEA
jgi:hypothetical protein